MSIFHILSRGWVLFKEKMEEERHKLLDNYQQRDPSRLILKKWKVDYEVEREPKNVQQIWEILPGLPMMFWKKEILEEIGGNIGKFISLEENQEQNMDR